jgi:hypothetical protein
MALPTPYVDKRRRIQPVDVRPYGNTIGIEADSDNPFEDDRPIQIVTQNSGGMAGPDPVMRSKRVMHKGTAAKAKPLPAGHVPTYRSRGAANRQGFMPGFGGFGVDLPLGPDDSSGGSMDEANPPGFVASSGIDPFSAASMSQDATVLPGVTTSTGGATAPSAFVSPAAAAPAAAKSPSSGPNAFTALQAAITAGGQIASSALATQQAKTAAAAAAKAKLPAPVSALGAQAKAYWPYIAAGVGAVVVLGLLFGGGGRSSTVVMSAPAPAPAAKTNPRKRRR